MAMLRLFRMRKSHQNKKQSQNKVIFVFVFFIVIRFVKKQSDFRFLYF